MTYKEAAHILDHPTEHWDKEYLEWDDDMILALDMAAGALELVDRQLTASESTTAGCILQSQEDKANEEVSV
jgi:hypothetical protein